MAFDSFFTRNETAPVIGIYLKEPITGKLSWSGEYDRLPLVEEIALGNTPDGPTEMRVFNAILNGSEDSALNRKIVTEMTKNFDTEYAVMSMIKEVSARRSILSGVLSRVSSKTGDKFIPATLSPLYTAIQEATNALGNLYVTDMEINYRIQQLVVSNSNALNHWKTNLYNILQTIYSLNEENYLPASWAYMMDLVPTAEIVLNDKNTLAWQAEEQFVLLNDAYSILEEDI